MSENNQYTFKDFKSDQEIRWCPGCGDTAILMAVQKAFAELDHNIEDYAVVSGIGCSSRFPYYMNTYGFHGIHGRAAAIASGTKVANPDLSVWMISGDGDSLAIGGNHFIHLVRRNVDINLILFNNQIYGLTKGQYSPTSEHGSVTKTSPFGTVEKPFQPGALVIGSKGTFFARAIDTQVKLSTEIYIEAARHKGTSVVEVLQNCVIYNDRIWAEITNKEFRDDRVILLEHGKPMVFGKERDKGLRMNGTDIEVVQLGNGISEDDLLVHDAHTEFAGIHTMLAGMEYPRFPVALGIIRAYQGQETYDKQVVDQIEQIQGDSRIKCMDDLLVSGSTWEVK